MSYRNKLATLSALAGILLFMALPVLGQSQSGHVYTIRYHQVHEGQEQAYNVRIVSGAHRQEKSKLARR